MIWMSSSTSESLEPGHLKLSVEPPLSLDRCFLDSLNCHKIMLLFCCPKLSELHGRLSLVSHLIETSTSSDRSLSGREIRRSYTSRLRLASICSLAIDATQLMQSELSSKFSLSLDLREPSHKMIIAQLQSSKQPSKHLPNTQLIN